jgi:hypothetical protein
MYWDNLDIRTDKNVVINVAIVRTAYAAASLSAELKRSIESV